MSSSDSPLIAQEETTMADKLYDAECMMHIQSSVASGYVVLLNNGAPSPKSNGKKKKKSPKKKKNGDPSLAFMALTSGNVLDACFGVENASQRGNSPARRKAQAAKDLIDQRATGDSFCELAVSTYCRAFKIVQEHDEQMSNLNCVTKCLKAGAIRKDTEQKLASTFSRLAKAVNEKR
ncbi:MAG: hypothetical protein SGILL_009425 [Bacillariaceae sp.]